MGCQVAKLPSCQSEGQQLCNSATLQLNNSTTLQLCNSATQQLCNSATHQPINPSTHQLINSLHPRPTLDDDAHVTHHRHVRQRVPAHSDDVCITTRREHADPVFGA